jgi:hypothetical protein
MADVDEILRCAQDDISAHASTRPGWTRYITFLQIACMIETSNN